ncbi:MAG: hypothetical protein HY852_03160 [Bradyrhizobium sp.]|uniref:hypothetical protein n=1 Tax=Bradyrhizobium sp. TaxID=376 RepID=UPI0025C29A3D|nr:hypothetical protein [Bradyrhizobium sp.]MBI5260802.1 hypothetical protein [Bradyrhizobium sp.]
MLDADITALLRALVNEMREGASQNETGAATHVASKMLEETGKGETPADALKQAGQKVLSAAPTMWR